MAAFNFPNSPSTNQTHTENGITFTWDGEIWKRAGIAGAQGAQGVQGSIGPQGHQGRQGAVGAQGHQGVQGTTGAQGHQGVQGATGGGGGAGAQGSQGHQGHQGVQGAGGSTTYAIPQGGIIIWSGASNAIPSGWVLCNGSNSTPDLRNRFVIGAGSSYSVGGTGGSKDAVVVTHTHGLNHNHNFSANTNNTGAHAHNYSKPNTNSDEYDGRPIGSGGSIGGGFGNYTTGNTGGHAHSLSGTTSESNIQSQGASNQVSGTDKNLPPYYALCYIMKT